MSRRSKITDFENIPKTYPKIGTKSFRDFYETWHYIRGFYYFVMNLVASVESTTVIAHEALVDVEKDEKIIEEMKEQYAKRFSSIDALKLHRQIFMEILLNRFIDNYLNYYSCLLNEIFIHRPETMKSNDKIDIQSILEQDSIEGFVRFYSEKKVENLSYKSFDELCAYFYNHFGLIMCDEKDKILIIEAIEIRNISVHNKCIINKRFINKTGIDKKREGEKRKIYKNYLDKLVPLLEKSVKKIDLSARKKLKLRAIRFNIK